MKIAFDSARESLPQGEKIKIKNFTRQEEIVTELFNIFAEQRSEKCHFYLPSHPIIHRFRELVIDTLKNQEDNHYDLANFFTNFNVILEAKAREAVKNDANFAQFYEASKLKQYSIELMEYLEYVRSINYELNPVDNKCFMEYYIQNNAVKVSIKTWNKSEDEIPRNNMWKVEDFLKSYNEPRVVIGASFGIGKTSYVEKLAVTYATLYIQGLSNYIPILVRLKKGLSNVYRRKDLDKMLQWLSENGREEQQKPLLVICDGLDEYAPDKVVALTKFLDDKCAENEMMKVIITTRLNPELPTILGLEDEGYVRLLSFDIPNQVNRFFKNYGIPEIKTETLKQFGLREKEMSKPLFCWMFAITYQPNPMVRGEDSQSDKMSRLMLYLNFIHSIILGRHRQISKTGFDYEKWVLRKIAALKMLYEDTLTENDIDSALGKFLEDEENKRLREFLLESEKRRVVALRPILTSYFRLGPTRKASSPMVDFIHESFKEYLLAEYYLESILADRYYRLNVGIPSKETIEFIDGMLELIMKDHSSERVKEIARELVESLSSDQTITLSEAREDIITNSKKFLENERIVLVFTDENDDMNMEYKNELWITSKLISARRYGQLWIHRWLSMHVYSKLDQGAPIKGKKLELLIQETGLSTPYYLKTLSRVDLQGANLSRTYLYRADLHGANLSHADFSRANLIRTYFRRANLSHANFSDAILIRSNLSLANLSYANLYPARLNHADLSHANLSHARLCYANLSHADLSDANLTCADLSFANLQCADLSNSIILGCKGLIRANLMDTDFENALVDDRQFMNYLRNSNAKNKNIDEAPKNIDELKTKLNERGFDSELVTKILIGENED
jgi:hypothetical protein